MTGERDLDATAILDYFKPLYSYLKEQNRASGATILNENPMTEEELEELLENDYAPAAQEVYTEDVHAEWNYATDIDNDEKQQAQVGVMKYKVTSHILTN